MKYIITYEDGQEVCKHYKNFNFSEHLYQIRGYKISVFDYFICEYKDFANPLPNKPDVNGFDMRGVTFVFNKDGSLWNRFLMLPKFFNLNQIEETQYDKLKDKEIDHISMKEDGSLVTFMMTPDDELFCKTIRGFTNDQAVRGLQLLYELEEHASWVKTVLKMGFTPLFEYVSWDNRIVLKYSKTELRLIGLRNNINGDFIPASRITKTLSISIPETLFVVEEVAATLDELIAQSKVKENIEGWVVIFKDGTMIKVKTAWYFNIHGVRTEHIFREDYIIRNYYEQTLDDVLCQLDPIEDKDAFEFVDKVTHAIDRYSNHIDECVEEMTKLLNLTYENDWTSFATTMHKKPYFGYVKFWIEDKEKYKKHKIDNVLALTYRLKRAQEIVDKWSK